RQHRAPSGAGWTNFRNNSVTIGNQNRLTTGGEPDILTQLIFERFETNGAHNSNVATRGYLVKGMMRIFCRPKIFRRAGVTAKAINYLLNRWAAFTRFLDDGRVCLSNNAAERALRGVAVGRKNWNFAGSDAGGQTLILS